jgi:hypothetical protein
LAQAASPWVRGAGWTLLARSQTPAPVLRDLWDQLLAATQETPALATALRSPDAFQTLARANYPMAVFAARLRERPFLLVSCPARCGPQSAPRSQQPSRCN